MLKAVTLNVPVINDRTIAPNNSIITPLFKLYYNAICFFMERAIIFITAFQNREEYRRNGGVPDGRYREDGTITS